MPAFHSECFPAPADWWTPAALAPCCVDVLPKVLPVLAYSAVLLGGLQRVLMPAYPTAGAASWTELFHALGLANRSDRRGLLYRGGGLCIGLRARLVVSVGISRGISLRKCRVGKRGIRYMECSKFEGNEFTSKGVRKSVRYEDYQSKNIFQRVCNNVCRYLIISYLKFFERHF